MAKRFADKDLVDRVVAFHGHICPGLAVGIRVSEIALTEIGPHSSDEEVVAVVETDMCGVDAIQFLTGCTFGKGNLLHLDYGKNAFSFFRRSDGKGIRIVAKPDAFGRRSKEWEDLTSRLSRGELSSEDRSRLDGLRKERIESILSSPLEELFEIQTSPRNAPRKARILNSLQCEDCRELVMESRVRRFMGKTLCIPCFKVYDEWQ